VPQISLLITVNFLKRIQADLDVLPAAFHTRKVHSFKRHAKYLVISTL